MAKNTVESLKKRFFKKFTKSNKCWVWTACKNKLGYGQIGLGGRKEGVILAHRLSWIIHNGIIPKNMFVLHRCDNPSCVRPSHLFIGSAKDNSDDKVIKLRHRFGESHGRAKLKNNDVKEIRHLNRYGITQKEIAISYNVSEECISSIIRKIYWKHIK